MAMLDISKIISHKHFTLISEMLFYEQERFEWLWWKQNCYGYKCFRNSMDRGVFIFSCGIINSGWKMLNCSIQVDRKPIVKEISLF